MDIRARLKELHKTQRWLILELHARDVIVQPPELSAILSGTLTHPKARRVLELADQILSNEECQGQR